MQFNPSCNIKYFVKGAKQMKTHKIHEIVENRLKEFVEDNSGIFESMIYGQIIRVHKDASINGCCISHLDMFAPPYNIKYFGKLDGANGDVYVFLDKRMDKIYTYVDEVII